MFFQAFASLWDDVTKQFLSHSSLTVLKHAVVTICHFLSATSLTNTNSTKILELEDELSSSLRDAVAGRDEIEVASFTEDEVLALGAICAVLPSLRAQTPSSAALKTPDQPASQACPHDDSGLKLPPGPAAGGSQPGNVPAGFKRRGQSKSKRGNKR